MQKESTGTTLNTDYKKIRENMRSKNKINYVKESKKRRKNIILASYFMTYNRVHERGRKRITKNIGIYKITLGKRRMGKIYDV